MAVRSFCIQLTISKLPIAHLITHPPRFPWYTVADTRHDRRIFHAFPVKPWKVLVRTILFTFLSSPNDLTSPTFPLLSCRDASFLKFSLRRVLCGAGLRPCRAATQGFVLISLRRVLLWCEIALSSCRDAKFCYVFSASRYYMGLFCSEMQHDAKFCADFFASCPVCLSGSVFWGAEWRYGLYDPEDTGLVFFEAF